MTYEKALELVHGRLRFGIKPGLDRMKVLLDRLGNPEKKLKVVHIAGTNGKGSVSTLMANALTANGYRTGLYTSPYVLDFRERFQIDSQMISEQELANCVEKIYAVILEMEREGMYVTEFELITAVAFMWFESCDIVVLEVGLGGRFDATNVIDTPLVSVIMSISYDHMQILGDTIEKITFEKAGIIKSGSEVVVFPEQEIGVTSVLDQVCEGRGATMVLPDMNKIEIKSAGLLGTELLYEGVNLTTPFIGRHQALNSVTAYEALKILRNKGIYLSDEKIKEGFKKTFIPARMEIISRMPLVILDGGHNPGCAMVLKKALEDYVGKKNIIAIIGMMDDKDGESIMKIIGPMFSEVIGVSSKNPRSMAACEVAKLASKYCKSIIADNLNYAIEKAAQRLDEDAALIVSGSLYLASDIRNKLKEKFSA